MVGTWLAPDLHLIDTPTHTRQVRVERVPDAELHDHAVCTMGERAVSEHPPQNTPAPPFRAA
jgi:hypothetical protein